MIRYFRRYSVWVALSIFIISACALPIYLTARWAKHHVRIFAYELEQATTSLETAHTGPSAALLQAQTHLAVARSELEILRPVAEPSVNIASKMTELPIVGTPAEQLVDLWIFAETTTIMSEKLVSGAQIGLVNFEANGIDGLVAAMPNIQADLQAAETSLGQAQAAQDKLGPVDQLDTIIWLSDDQTTKLKTALTRWDVLAPALDDILREVNQLLVEVDLAQAWLDVQTLTYELEQVSAILETVEKNPFQAMKETQKHLIAAQVAFESLRPAVEPLMARVDKLVSLLETTPLAEKDLLPSNLFQQMVAWWRFTESAILLGGDLTAVVELGFLNVDQAGIDGVMAAMPTIQNHLQSAEKYLAQIQAVRVELEPIGWLPDNMATPFNTALTQWDTFAPTLEDVVFKAEPLARVLPLILGNEKPMTYLLLIQSSDQLRATGGWIGGVGLIEIDNGKITSVTMREIGEFDHYGQKFEVRIWPPAPLNLYMGKNHWRLRDANWWADFPASARQAKILWDEENDIHIDGVIAVSDQTVARWLAIMGPVEDLSGEEVSQENVLEFAADRIYGGSGRSAHSQTSLLQEMALVFVTLTQDLSAEKALQMARFLRETVNRKEFLITMHDHALAAILNELEIDGAMQGQQDDYFYLIESNVADTKTSQLIQQDLKYEVELDSTAWPTLATLTVDQINTFTPEDKLPGAPENNYRGGRWNFETEVFDRWPGYYGGYTRLFPTNGSEFTTVTGFDEGPYIYDEDYRTVVGGYVGLHPGQQRQLQLKWIPYGQPNEPGRYRLLMQRQPGAPEHALNVVVRLPAGYRAIDISPPALSVTEDSVTWHVVLDQDQSFSLRLEDDGSGLVTAPVVEPDSPPIVSATSVVSATPAAVQTNPRPVVPAPEPEPYRAPLPAWLSIPSIGVGSPLVSVGLEPSGIMGSPDEADIAGWYELGPRPGEPSNAIIAAHVDWRGEIGVFAQLHKLKPGDTVEIQSGPETSFHYIVESIEIYEANTAPVAEIFGPTFGQSTLTLITCGGPYDYRRQEYRDRVVVRARGTN